MGDIGDFSAGERRGRAKRVAARSDGAGVRGLGRATRPPLPNVSQESRRQVLHFPAKCPRFCLTGSAGPRDRCRPGVHQRNRAVGCIHPNPAPPDHCGFTGPLRLHRTIAALPDHCGFTGPLLTLGVCELARLHWKNGRFWLEPSGNAERPWMVDSAIHWYRFCVGCISAPRPDRPLSRILVSNEVPRKQDNRCAL